MAKEGDIKRVELKVTVHCCDGCKKKVKKILRSIEGVLNVEIDTMEPKVTVLGNVEPQKLIKKLSKVGKQAEIWSCNNQNATKEDKESRVSPSTKSDTENLSSGREPMNRSETHHEPMNHLETHREPMNHSETHREPMNHSETQRATSTEKHTESVVSKEGAGSKGLDQKNDTLYGCTSGMIRTGNPLLYQPEASGVLIHPSITTHDGAYKVISRDTLPQQYYYMVEPARGPVILPYCAVYPYNAPPVCTRRPELYNYGQTMLEPPVQAPASTTVLGDYFNDENTVGCQIM
ncbi:HMA domain-containing protein [Heracleum sosnowskyi]|uniref:HMA domain-containing protein n=1 Tax=Heracleum sosnowskyi TaxID=360622 RepID=A0AAD8H413_9APIA|nr:HMA domain-containing protein [Heracleum sosnowskyi]